MGRVSSGMGLVRPGPSVILSEAKNLVVHGPGLVMPGSDLVMPGPGLVMPGPSVMPGSDLVMPGSDRASHPRKTTHSAFGAQNAHRVARLSQTIGKNSRLCSSCGSTVPDDRQKRAKMPDTWHVRAKQSAKIADFAHRVAQLDQVHRCFGPGPITGAGPGPLIVAQTGLEGRYAGPGPRDESGPSPNRRWTRSTGALDRSKQVPDQVQHRTKLMRKIGVIAPARRRFCPGPRCLVSPCRRGRSGRVREST